MGVVAEFFESGDAGWDITRGEFLFKALEELPLYPDVMVIVTKDKTALINRNYVRVRMIDRSDAE